MKVRINWFPVSRIVSGGQTGADRAALDLAINHGIEHGGWCLKGRLAEDGVIPLRYKLTELSGAGYRARTKGKQGVENFGIYI